MMWALISPYDVSELLEIRAGGKGIPSFKARQKPNPKPGARARPETEVQRICREIHNLQGEILATWLHFQNLVIPCANPLTEFWSKLISKTDDWEITPSHGLYEHIKESGSDISSIKSLTNKTLLSLMGEMVLQSIRVPTASDAGKELQKLFEGFYKKSGFRWVTDGVDVNMAKFDVDVPTMSKLEIPGDILDKTKKFLGYTPLKQTKRGKKSGQAAVHLNTEVLKELEFISHSPMHAKVKEWLATTFKTGQNKLVQATAARLVAGEVLKHQDALLGEDFDEFNYLEELEEEEDF
jgi:hypothetical protein